MGHRSPQFEVAASADAPTIIAGRHTARTVLLFGRKSVTRGPAAFYVEFRAARNGVYGHSYIAYGRLDRDGVPASAQFADVHPDGGFLGMVIGHFLPIAALTEPDSATFECEIASAYRCGLDASDHEVLTAAIVRTRAACRRWNVFSYNCNDFCADVARAIGLRTPSTLMRPCRFIPALHRLNSSAAASGCQFAPSGFPQTA